MRTRRLFLSFAVLGLALALGTLAVLRLESRETRRPHVVLIVVDTLRADRLGAWGYPEPISPELDRLAARGVRFARVIAQSSWTRPSIGSLITARYPRSIGIYREKHDILPDAAQTLAETLRVEGYRTFGTTANPNLNSIFNFQQGFDHYGESLAVWDWMRGEPDDASLRKEAPIRPAADLFAEAVAWVDRPEQAGRPLFLQFVVMEVHEHKFPETRRPRIRELFRGHEEEGYLQAVRQVSGDVGELVQALADRAGWDDALFVVTSDHGEGLGDHPGVGGAATHGRTLYESQVHVPLILYSPGEILPSGTVVERPVRLLDVMPTILELIGVEGPAEMEGASLVPLLRGGSLSLPASFAFETEFQGVDKIGIAGEEWKLILSNDRQAGTDRLELQLNAGPEDGSRTNRASERPELVRSLVAELRRWQRAHPRAQAEQPGGEGPSESEIDQLRALGYVQ